jgi:integrase
MWQRVVKKAGIESATVHDLRHTFGVHATRSGIPVATIQSLMGHARPTMTLRYMKHCPNTYRTHDAQLLARSMFGDGTPARSPVSIEAFQLRKRANA